MAIDRNNLGSAYDSLGEHVKALEYYQLALFSDLKTNGEAHPRVAAMRNNLGDAHYKPGDYKKALEEFSVPLDIRKQKLGKDHPDTQDSLWWTEETKKAISKETK